MNLKLIEKDFLGRCRIQWFPGFAWMENDGTEIGPWERSRWWWLRPSGLYWKRAWSQIKTTLKFW